MASKTLSGKYEREGSRLRNEERELLIVSRPAKERTRAKSGEYLLEIKPDGSRRYVSSLWPTNEDETFVIEFQRTRYRVSLAELDVYFDEVTFDRS